MANWRVTTTSGPETSLEADIILQEDAALICATADGETVAVFARGAWRSAVKVD